MNRPVHQARTTQLAARLAVAAAAGRWAAQQIATTPPTGVAAKAHQADLVTIADRAIETEVRKRIAGAFPLDQFRGEEYGDRGRHDARYIWYCDPIDGTTNYANRIPWCCFSLSCWDEQGPLIGVVVDPFRREMFLGRRGGGADLRQLDGQFEDTGTGARLAAYDGCSLAGTVVTTEWLAHLPWPGMVATLRELAERACTVRIMGSSALAILQAAAGRAAACIIGAYSAIDDSAAALIAVEAGAVVCDRDGERTLVPGSGGLLVAGRHVAPAVRKAWQHSDEQPAASPVAGTTHG